MTKGWEFYIKWKDGHCTWIKLKDLKESFPLELLQYVEYKKITKEPAFAWWIPFIKRQMKCNVKKLKTKYWEKTHKYGIKIPKDINEAARFDKENGNTLWMDAIKLEMKNVRIAFERFEANMKDLEGFDKIRGHLIFDIKLGENFRRKA